MTIEVNLQVKPLNFADPLTQADIEALSDYDWAVVNGISLMTVFSEGDPVADSIQALRCAAGRNIEVIRVFDEQVNHGEIARRVGVSREAVRKWSKESAFPLPIGSGGGERPSAQYRWADVISWLEQVKGLEMNEDLPDEKTVIAINAHIQHIFKANSKMVDYPVDFGTEPRIADVLRLPTGTNTPAWTVTVVSSWEASIG